MKTLRTQVQNIWHNHKTSYLRTNREQQTFKYTCKPTPPTRCNWWLMTKGHSQKTGRRERQRWKCEGDTHHKLNVVEAIRQQVVFILHQTDVVQPLSYGLDGAAGAYQGVQREAFEKWVAIHPVAATVWLRELALPHHVPRNVTVKRTRHAQQATESASANRRDGESEKKEVEKWFQGNKESNV